VPHVYKALRSRRLEHPRDRLAAIGILFRIRLYRFVESHRVMFRALEPGAPPARPLPSRAVRADQPYE
jgi:hypothetical protein